MAVTQGKIADILFQRGELDEALRIRKEEEMPVYERLGDVREMAVTQGKIADILFGRGELDEALRIRKEEEMPVYERLGDVREMAITQGKIADILFQRGELDGALRIRKEEEMPVYERLGDVRSVAITQGKIADILFRRGELDEALRIHREERLPTCEKLGDLDGKAHVLFSCAQLRLARAKGEPKRDEIEAILNELGESFAILRKLERPDGVAAVGSLLGQVLAAGGATEPALKVLEEAAIAYELRSPTRRWGKQTPRARCASCKSASG